MAAERYGERQLYGFRDAGQGCRDGAEAGQTAGGSGDFHAIARRRKVAARQGPGQAAGQAGLAVVCKADGDGQGLAGRVYIFRETLPRIGLKIQLKYR